MSEKKEPMMTPEQAAQWKRKWAVKREMRLKAMREMTMADKLRELADLMEFARYQPPDPRREAEVEMVRQRWIKIKQRLNNSQ